MKNQFFQVACFFYLASTGCYAESNTYQSFDKLPSQNPSQVDEKSPYSSFSQLPSPSQERHDTLQNEYSAPNEYPNPNEYQPPNE